jgi:NAD(P)-dependent dehydrogenase (short-subunit alcohol dehydrogenase family)
VTAPDHRGEVAVITGTTHGSGRVTARELARCGYTVAMLCRDTAAGAAVRREIAAAVPAADVRVVGCDLASLQSVRSAARAVLDEFAAIDLLINNAGIVSARRRTSVDGFELTFATNHLGPFLLTEMLRGRLSAGARIVTVASRAHYRARLDLRAVTDARIRHRPVAAYDQSKLANVMHSFALARRLAGSPATVNCLHPGVVASNLLPRWLRIVKPLFTRATFDVERGALTTLHVALSPSLRGRSGLYLDEYQKPQSASAQANDVTLQEMLWERSVLWTSPGG